MQTIEYTARLTDMPSLWQLSDRQLAQSCLYIARGRFPEVKPFLRAQAVRVFLLWRDAITAQCRTQADFERAAGSLAALRKRTIQLLVRLSLLAAQAPEAWSSGMRLPAESDARNPGQRGT